MKKYEKEKVLVAMSGGVDSSVAAALLKKQGYNVLGVYLRLADKKNLKKTEAYSDEKSAQEVAGILKIPLKIIDARKEFNKTIVSYFLEEYKNGRTPNPCAVCNPKIKFVQILKLADKMGIKYVATGHYATIFPHSLTPFPNGRGRTERKRRPGEGFKLFSGIDKTKDQSYFLYGLNQAQFSRIIFPLGGYKKTEVKEMARKMKLPVFDRKESHDVCFISGKAEEYLRQNIKMKKGKIVDRAGNVLAEHRGLPLYTIGQRKGIEIGGVGPFYVIEKNVKKNQLLVSDDEIKSGLFKKEMFVNKINWINKPLKFPLQAKVKIRYGHPAICATIKPRINADKKFTADKNADKNADKKCTADKNADKNADKKCTADMTRMEYIVRFEEAQRAITPGQSAVFYTEKGEVLGGGTIEK